MRYIAIVLLISTIFGCTDTKNEVEGQWKVVGKISGYYDNILVEIGKGFPRDKSVYIDAKDNICVEEKPCVIIYILEGDRIPPTQSFSSFVKNGGWRQYRKLASWNIDKFVEWDCDRAGEERAPLSALCGLGVDEAYGAIGALAGRINVAQYCKWEANPDDEALVESFIQKIVQAPRREQFAGFVRMLSSSHPNSPDFCVTGKDRLEKDATEARAFLRNQLVTPSSLWK